MTLYDGGSWILVALMAIGWGYSSYTAKDFKEIRDFAQKHAVEIKERYVEVREDCQLKDGTYKEDSLCQKIKEIDPEARELWSKLKEADDKAQVIEDNLERLETIKGIVMDGAESVSKL